MAALIQDIKPVFPPSTVARFNVAAWQNARKNSIVLIGREVSQSPQPGQPDIGNLVLVEVNQHGRVLHERIVWEPQYETLYLEDPRAMVLPDGNIIIGLTALLRKSNGEFDPFPALVELEKDWDADLPPVTLIQTFGPGKNLTPFLAHTFMFRPDSIDYHHKLIVFKIDKFVPRLLSEISFPTNLPWAAWRIGTTIPPIWLTSTEALLIFHGITIHNNLYHYSLGAAKLYQQGDHYQLAIYPKPIINPDTFLDDDGKPLAPELRPYERRVVYACGGILNSTHDQLILYTNVGDHSTFAVHLSLDTLKHLPFQTLD